MEVVIDLGATGCDIGGKAKFVYRESAEASNTESHTSVRPHSLSEVARTDQAHVVIFSDSLGN